MLKYKSLNRTQAGAAIAEYVVGAAFVMAALFSPVLQAEGGDGRTSAAIMLVEALKRNYEAYVWAMSVPL